MLKQALVFAALFAQLANAQGASITGFVHDSISHAPLAGAGIQLVAAENPALMVKTGVSDSLGRFSLVDVPNGRYALGFLHPMLDSLGVDLPLKEIFIDNARSVRADLAIPGALSLRRAICGRTSARDSVGVVVGFLRDASTDQPISNAAVSGEWLELTLQAGGFARRVPKVVAATADNGWFAICNVPSGGTIVLNAARGTDSTAVVDVQVPADGFVRRDLFLGASETVLVADNTVRTDTAKPIPRRIHVGNARLNGTVIAEAGGRPLDGAIVAIVDGPQVRANQEGEWSITNAPSGTRILEVRALGYYPVRKVINVAQAGPHLRFAMSTMKSVLDTVRISATRRYTSELLDFERRRKSGLGGKYLSADDIMRRQPIVTSDLFKTMPGVYVDRSPLGETMLSVRGMFQERCSPNVYVDGHYMWDMSADALDDYVKPNKIAGLEVYNGTMVPPQFQPGLNGCGSIVIWTK